MVWCGRGGASKRPLRSRAMTDTERARTRPAARRLGGGGTAAALVGQGGQAQGGAAAGPAPPGRSGPRRWVIWPARRPGRDFGPRRWRPPPASSAASGSLLGGGGRGGSGRGWIVRLVSPARSTTAAASRTAGHPDLGDHGGGRHQADGGDGRSRRSRGRRRTRSAVGGGVGDLHVMAWIRRRPASSRPRAPAGSYSSTSQRRPAGPNRVVRSGMLPRSAGSACSCARVSASFDPGGRDRLGGQRVGHGGTDAGIGQQTPRTSSSRRWPRTRPGPALAPARRSCAALRGRVADPPRHQHLTRGIQGDHLRALAVQVHPDLHHHRARVPSLPEANATPRPKHRSGARSFMASSQVGCVCVEPRVVADQRQTDKACLLVEPTRSSMPRITAGADDREPHTGIA
jgi:hypothetical protein